MPLEFFQSRAILWAPYHFIINGQEYDDDLGQSLPYSEFYALMAAGAEPTTSCVNSGQFELLWTPELEAGHDILHISFSSGLSSGLTAAMLAAQALSERYPQRRIEVVDSLGASSGYGLLVSLVADRRDQGATLDEARDWAEAHKLHLHHWFFSTDLTNYIRGGRISKTAGTFGTLLNICPLLNMNTEGKLIPREKIRSKKRVIKTIVERMEQHCDKGLDYDGRVYMCHSQCYEDARAVADLVEARFTHLAEPVLINYTGTVIGSHTGPGTVALFFEGDKRVQ